MLVDTHCHIHEADYPIALDTAIANAEGAGVGKMVCVGTSEDSSRRAVEAAKSRHQLFAAIGVHPHDAKDGWQSIEPLAQQAGKGVVAVGEVGLDYFYTHSPRADQIAALEFHIDLATRYDIPIIFHVRDAFDDFWPIFDNFKNLKGVLHSYTDNRHNLDEALARGLFIGVNGISTFTKDETQRHLFDAIPLESLLLETDAPFLTPPPYRGTVNQPAFVREIAQYHASRRAISLDVIAAATSRNASTLFRFS